MLSLVITRHVPSLFFLSRSLFLTLFLSLTYILTLPPLSPSFSLSDLLTLFLFQSPTYLSVSPSPSPPTYKHACARGGPGIRVRLITQALSNRGGQALHSTRLSSYTCCITGRRRGSHMTPRSVPGVKSCCVTPHVTND